MGSTCRAGSAAQPSSGRGGTAGRVQQRVRSALVVSQIALALVALAGSGLLLRTFQQLTAPKKIQLHDRTHNLVRRLRFGANPDTGHEYKETFSTFATSYLKDTSSFSRYRFPRGMAETDHC